MAAPTQNHDLLLFFFSLSFFPCSLLSSSPRCPVPKSDCGLSDPTIHFPFRLHPFQPSSCGFPDQGFNLTCSGPNNLTLLHLPKSGSGPFSIQDIDYVTQEILLNDPNNCLPRRLLSLNLSGSPFSPVHHQDFSLYNCSSKSVDYKYLTPITCLSGSGYRVFAVDVDLGRTMFGSSCNQIEVVRVPVRAKFIEESSSDLSEDIRLKWSDPDCKHCYRAGGWCGLRSGSSVEIDCFAHPRSRVHGVTIGIGVAALICLLGTICCVLMKFGCRTSITRRAEARLEAAVNGGTQSPSAAAIAVPVGIDQPTIESFPKVVLGESRRVPRGEEITCAICLGDYQPKETLRTLPECTHSFHVECIDEWLRSHGTCPVCRNSLPHNVV